MTEDIFTNFTKFVWLKLEFKIKSYKRKQKRIKRKEKKTSRGEPAQPSSSANHWISYGLLAHSVTRNFKEKEKKKP